jgi:hypothetical protein
MKIDFNAQLKNIDGTLMEDPKTVRGKVVDNEWIPVTLGYLCSNAVGKFVDDEKLSFKERDSQGALAVKIYDGEHELSDEERVLVKKLCAKVYPPYVCHQIASMFDKPDQK